MSRYSCKSVAQHFYPGVRYFKGQLNRRVDTCISPWRWLWWQLNTMEELCTFVLFAKASATASSNSFASFALGTLLALRQGSAALVLLVRAVLAWRLPPSASDGTSSRIHALLTWKN